jgi:DNA-binding NarL/FixJ family response regulator
MNLPTALIADDHAIIVDGLRRILQDHVTILDTFSDGETLLDATRRLSPDLVISDISMPRMNGLEFLRQLSPGESGPRVILLTMYVDPVMASEAINAGAVGYVPKHCAGEELIGAIDAAMRGDTYLSPLVTRHRPASAARSADLPPPRSRLSERQRQVLRLVASGKRMKEIAAQLKLSQRTVEMHKYRMMRILGLRTTAELVQYFVREGEGADSPTRITAH